MTIPIPQPILAAGLQAIITIAIFLISIIAWIINQANEKNRQNPRGAAPKPQPRPDGDRFQNEIDMFLNEVQGKPKPEYVPIEIVSDDEIRERQHRDANPGELGTMAGRSLRDRHLESGVGTHVDQHMYAESEVESVESSIGREFASLSSHTAVASSRRVPSTASARNVVKWLQNPRDVQKAIIVGEILAPCRSLPARQ